MYLLVKNFLISFLKKIIDVEHENERYKNEKESFDAIHYLMTIYDK